MITVITSHGDAFIDTTCFDSSVGICESASAAENSSAPSRMMNISAVVSAVDSSDS